eukprot:360458-Chlamydomonas_euryale.AAC.5
MALIASGPYHYHTSAGKKARHRSTRMVTFPQTTMRIESLFTLRPPATPWVTTECPDAGLPVCGPRKAVAQLHHKANDAMGDRQMPKRLNVRPCAEKGRRAASSQGQHSPNPHKSMPEWPPFSPGCRAAAWPGQWHATLEKQCRGRRRLLQTGHPERGYGIARTKACGPPGRRTRISLEGEEMGSVESDSLHLLDDAILGAFTTTLADFSGMKPRLLCPPVDATLAAPNQLMHELYSKWQAD